MVWVSQPIEYRKSIVLSIGMPVKISGGLPCIIPTPLRRKMEEGCGKTLKLVLTILSLYRIWPCPPKLKLSTITDPFNGISSSLPILEVKKAITFFKPYFGKPKLKVKEVINLTTAGPNNPISSLSAPFDAYAMSKESAVFNSFEDYCSLTDNMDFFHALETEYKAVRWETLLSI
jgi:hypothetical protein